MCSGLTPALLAARTSQVRAANGELRERAVEQLSGGERKRGALALGTAYTQLAAARGRLTTNLLVFDEVNAVWHACRRCWCPVLSPYPVHVQCTVGAGACGFWVAMAYGPCPALHEGRAGGRRRRMAACCGRMVRRHGARAWHGPRLVLGTRVLRANAPQGSAGFPTIPGRHSTGQTTPAPVAQPPPPLPQVLEKLDAEGCARVASLLAGLPQTSKLVVGQAHSCEPSRRAGPRLAA